ncbi:MAG: hypothetical protein ABIQ40_16355 [Bacteroidia bacterium]
MPKRRKIFTLILALLLIAAMILYWQSRNQKMMLADVRSSNGAQYSMELPNDFVPADFNDTLPEMSLQYENAQHGLHVLVIDESKAKIISFGLDYDLDTYMKIATRTQDKDGVYVNKPLTINGNKALQTEIKETSNGVKKMYKLTCIETQKFFYQLLIWSEEDKYTSNKEDMEKMVNSFKER